MRWWRNRRSAAEWEAREVETISLLYAGRFDDAADELDAISTGYAALGDYPGAARALVRRVDPLVNALRMGELGADSFRLGDMISRIPANLRDEFDDFREVASGRLDSGTPLTARTVAEAMVYLELANGAPVDQVRRVSGSREAEVFYLRHHLEGQPPTRLMIPVRPVDGARFGDGRSELVDAGQWIVLAEQWQAQLGSPGSPGSLDSLLDADEALVRARVRDAYRQALAFIPAGADKVATDGVWTPASRTRREEEPELFHRTWLESQRDAP